MNDEFEEVNETEWECEDEHIPFVKFPPEGGSYLMVIDGYQGSRMNKFGKAVYDFRVRVADNGNDPKVWRDMKLSVSSRKLRAGITKVKNAGYNNGVFFGNVPIVISWEGKMMDRWYDVSAVTIEHSLYDVIMRSLGIHPA